MKIVNCALEILKDIRALMKSSKIYIILALLRFIRSFNSNKLFLNYSSRIKTERKIKYDFMLKFVTQYNRSQIKIAIGLSHGISISSFNFWCSATVMLNEYTLERKMSCVVGICKDLNETKNTL